MQNSIRHSGKLPGWLLGLVIAITPEIRAEESTPTAPFGTTKDDSELFAAYKKMSLEELMNQKVTSVAKQPERYGQSPAAIQVVTGEEIHRSGATSLPEALRLGPNLTVAQVNSHDWAISARGFNDTLANKLVIMIDGRTSVAAKKGGPDSRERNAGVDNFGTLLDDAVHGEKSNHRPIVVKRFRTVQEVKNCQMLFISSSDKTNLRKILPQLKGLPILTVAEFDGFIRAGGMIQFLKNPENKIRLKINANAAKATSLSVSARLLRVAEIVRPEED